MVVRTCKLTEPAPPALPGFITTMGPSEPGRRLGTLVGSPLVPFPFPSPTSSSVRKPGSRLLYTGHRMASKQVSSMLIPEQCPVLVSSEAFRCVIGGSLALVSRIHSAACGRNQRWLPRGGPDLTWRARIANLTIRPHPSNLLLTTNC